MSCMQGANGEIQLPKSLKNPYLETAGYPLLLRLRKRRFKCKECRKMAVAETPLVKKNHQIYVTVDQKIAQLLIENQTMTHIAHRLSISTSTVIRKLNEFTFKTDGIPYLSGGLKQPSETTTYVILERSEIGSK